MSYQFNSEGAVPNNSVSVMHCVIVGKPKYVNNSKYLIIGIVFIFRMHIRFFSIYQLNLTKLREKFGLISTLI